MTPIPKRRLGCLSGAALALLLAGCASDLKPTAQLLNSQQLETRATLAQAPARNDAWPRDTWWHNLGDPQLDRLVAEALAGSPNLTLAQARLSQAKAYIGLAESSEGVQVNASTNIQREHFPEGYLIPPPYGGATYNVGQLGLDFSYELDFWGRNKAGIAAAISQAKAAEAESAATRLMLAVAVTRSYIQLDRQYHLLDVAQRTLAQRQKILELTRQRYAAGLDSSIELKQSEGSVPAAKTDVESIQESIDLLRHQLAALTGAGPDRGLSLQRPKLAPAAPLALPADLPAELLGRRADLTAQRWRVEAATKDIAGAKAAFYPNVNLAAFAGFQSIGLGNLLHGVNKSGTFGPAISLPIFDGGRLRSNLALKNGEYDAAVAQYNQTLLDAVRDVADQVSTWQSVERQLVDQAQALSAAEQAYGAAQQRYGQGLVSYLTVLSAESQVLTQRRLQAELQARRADTAVALIRALGGGYQARPQS